MFGKGWKWLLLGVGVTIIVLYMLEMTTTGMERVYGPMQIDNNPKTEQTPERAPEESGPQTVLKEYDSALERQIAQLEQEILELKKLALEKEKEELQAKMIVNHLVTEPSVNRLADSTAGVLQQVSGSGIQFIAGIFHDIIN